MEFVPVPWLPIKEERNKRSGLQKKIKPSFRSAGPFDFIQGRLPDGDPYVAMPD
jgi:hypothetical protein